MALPTYEWSALQAMINGDAAVILSGDAAGPALYHAGGSGAGVLVRAFVGPDPVMPQKAMGRVQGAGLGTTEQARLVVMVAASVPGEAVAGGVGASGGIVAVNEGDRFTVPGRAVSKPAEAEVSVRVVGKARLTAGGVWDAEVRL